VKTGSRHGSPFYHLLVSSRKRRRVCALFLGDAHRESGVFSLCCALSPVESCSPPKLVELASYVRPGFAECKRRNVEICN
jgi:hypothetical protein